MAEGCTPWAAEDDFTAFVQRHRPEWLRLAIVVSANRDDAEDVIQDATLSLSRVWWRLRRSGAPAYARRVIVHTAVDLARSRRDVPSDDLPTSAEALELLRYQQDQNFFSLIAQLPTTQRAALVCRYYLDLADADTARALGCSRATVRSHIRRGVLALRMAFPELEPDESTGTTR